MKCTPGPWKVHHDMRDCVTFEGIDGEENLFTQNSGEYFACQNSADAHLIAAAPELLEALKAICEMWATVCHVNGHDPEHMIQYNNGYKAIAKATGNNR